MPVRPLQSFAADAALVLHLVWVAAAVFGGFGVLVDPRILWIHLPIVLWSSIVNLMGWTCPLTPIETRLREAGGGVGYSGGFIEHYVGSIVYPGGMPRRLELTAGVSILVWNVVVYAFLLS
jgi:hypothetical protein